MTQKDQNKGPKIRLFEFCRKSRPSICTFFLLNVKELRLSVLSVKTADLRKIWFLRFSLKILSTNQTAWLFNKKWLRTSRSLDLMFYGDLAWLKSTKNKLVSGESRDCLRMPELALPKIANNRVLQQKLAPLFWALWYTKNLKPLKVFIPLNPIRGEGSLANLHSVREEVYLPPPLPHLSQEIFNQMSWKLACHDYNINLLS